MSGLLAHIDVFSKTRELIKGIASDVAKLNQIPIDTRKKYIEVIDETMLLLDQALMLVILRLGNLLKIEDDDEFLTEMKQISWYHPWLEMERSILLCKNLRKARSEMQNIFTKLKDYLSISNINAVNDAISDIFHAEGELAGVIGNTLKALENAATEIEVPDEIKLLRTKTRKSREIFQKERHKLIQNEKEIMDFIHS